MYFRKKARQLLEQSSARFNTDADEVVSKHNKRWTNKINAVRLIACKQFAVVAPFTVF